MLPKNSPFKIKDPHRPYGLIGLTGGIGSGKSLVAEYLREHGWPVVNLDDLGRALTDKSPEIQKRIAQITGAAFPLKRAEVRQKIFADPEKRRELEKYLHPLILHVFKKRCEELDKDGYPFIFCEAALLIESGYDRDMDALIWVRAPKDLRVARVIERDGIDEKLAHQIIEAQVGDQEYESRATYTINNIGSKKALAEAVSTTLDCITECDMTLREKT